ncbi:MAG: hypothetical protein A3B47_02770 [Candidatus Levybacteria bacterium RIFCSPLOWO2_01_FULL_39_24]|nr:MAG: hypothetical protein A2800_02060 [Candidatus Levybacteria bacterium RIFCSPHIGHO2_01_FULL_40_16]OGH28817.1 MAG: hypothetical protein A3E12_03955 [Candidatus Levybacteria bacterium RIFCSPHIGHO2_12_FULL_39_9]OGH46544.1 MAG: hypothetical protein A3B47_02770 [Candidatus Levybacteria bacterium RIFCSPLOWO2_01_FULL_39_24]
MKILKAQFKKGFTLIELLIVIAVVGVLGTGVLVAIDPAGKINSANIAKAETFSAGIQNNLAIDLVGEWTFDDGTFKDTSGNGNNGMGINVTPALDRRNRNKASNFNGTAYIDAGNRTSLKPDVFTVEAWIKWQSGIYWPLVSFSASGLPAILPVWTAGRSLIYLGAGNFKYFFHNPVNIADGNWHHLVFIVTGNGQNDIDNAKMYADGRIQIADTIAKTGLPNSKTGPLYIGFFSGYYANGLIDDVRIYKQALTFSQIQQLYAQGLIKHLLAFK